MRDLLFLIFLNDYSLALYVITCVVLLIIKFT